LIGCNNNDSSDNITGKKDIELVTGINIIDEIGQPLIEYGNPNVFSNNFDTSNFDY